MPSRLGNKKRVAICGITGSQGGWVYKALKGDDQFDLVGFSRNLPRAITKLGLLDDEKQQQPVTLMEADLLDLESLRKVFEGADYVFAMTQPWSADYTVVNVQGEIQQGQNIVQACLDCKVQHLIFSSADHEMERSGIPHVDSKVEIEELIQQAHEKSFLNYTLLQPVQFADNIGSDFFPIQPNCWIRGFVDADAKVPYVCCRDIAFLTKAILQQPEYFVGQSIRVIGDMVSGEELAATVTQLRTAAAADDKTKQQVFRYYAIPRFIVRLFSKEFYLMRVYFEDFGRDPVKQAKAKDDIARLRTIVPDLSTIQDHLQREGWDTRALISAEEEEQQAKKKKALAYTLMLVTVVAAAAFFMFPGRKRRR